MHLYIVRHGVAAPAATGGDAARELTHQGRLLLKHQCTALAAAQIPVEALLHSPLVRARQTAELLAPAFQCEPEPERLMAPGVTVDDLAEIAGRYSDDAHVMVIGHQPDLGRLVKRFTQADVRVVEGIIMVVDVRSFTSPRGFISGIYHPETLARIGGAMGEE